MPSAPSVRSPPDFRLPISSLPPRRHDESTPYSLAFYVHTVTTGTVLGARPTDSADQVAAVLGTDFAEGGSGGRTMFRDDGLADFHFHRDRAGDPWAGHHFSLQVHRLAIGPVRLPGPVLRDRYGRFAPRLRFEKLRGLLRGRGVPLVEIPDYAGNSPHYRTFWQPASQTAVTFVAVRSEFSTPAHLRPETCTRSPPP